jgi:phage-related protein
MQARFLRLSERIVSAGLESLGEPHVKHIDGKLWELRLTGRDGIARALYVTAIGRRVVVVRAFRKKTQKPREPKSNSRYGEPMRSHDNPVRQAQGAPSGQPEGESRI